MCHKVYNGKGNKGKAREKGLGQVQHGNHGNPNKPKS
jgi:hypothetical protein